MHFKLYTAAILMAWGICSSLASAQDTTATAVETQETTAPEAAVSPAAPDDADTTHSIVLVGEKAGLDSASPKKGPFPDLVGATTSTLGTDVADFTFVGATLAETANAVEKASNASADVAVVFGGLSDEKQEVADEEINAAIMKLGKALKSRNPEMRIFLLPTSTYVSTLINARMRLAAEVAGITFLPLGTELGGDPFVEAMAGVRAELTRKTASPVEAEPTPAPAAASNAVTIRGKNVETAPAEDVRPGTASYEARQASLEQELNRIAGETEDSGILPSNVEALSTSSLLSEPADATTTIPEGGVLTKRGKEAQENINMRLLPALKAYRPQIPVPRNETDKKEPSLSR